jgi:hypothetical protein
MLQFAPSLIFVREVGTKVRTVSVILCWVILVRPSKLSVFHHYNLCQINISGLGKASTIGVLNNWVRH